MPERTHDGPVQRAVGASCYASELENENPAPSDWVAAAVGCSTVGELEQVVAKGKAAGVFGERDLTWARALWAAFGAGGHWAAIALVRRELGATVLEAAS